MITKQNVQIPAGDTPTLVIAIAVSDGSAFDPTGAQATWWMGKAATSSGADILLKKSTDPAVGGAVFNQDATTLEWSLWVSLAEADTEDLTPQAYYHEVLIVEADGMRSRLMTGSFTVTSTIIR